MNSFLTLTYSDEFYPNRGSLNYKHFQLFMKRLRKALSPHRISFYMAGEYGEETQRPHYHACVFGYRPGDLVQVGVSGSGQPYYRSESLTRLWGLGHVTVGDVTFESAAYVARYVTKKVTGPRAEAHYAKLDLVTGEICQVEPEFNRMSLNPAIGSRWLDKYSREVYPRDWVVIRGKKMKPPKYYDKKYSEANPAEFDSLSIERYHARLRISEENTDNRLRVRETVARARLNQGKRKL